MSNRESAKSRARVARLAREAELKAKAERRRLFSRAGVLAAFLVAVAAGVAVANHHGPTGQGNAPAPGICAKIVSEIAATQFNACRVRPAVVWSCFR